MTLNKTERILAAINYFLPHDDLYQYVERRIMSGTDDVLFSGDPVSLTTYSDRSDMNCAA